MTAVELGEIVNQRKQDPNVIGRLACNLRSSHPLAQRHEDDRSLNVTWRESGDSWRCTISFEGEQGRSLAQLDIHENATIRVDVHAPCRVTVSPEEGILCVTRYRS